MSKKKAFSGSTMTLKDFHGGSIPSDLPLPSAPGVVVRPSDRPGFDRSSSWGNTMGRPDLRPRPSSSPATRHLDEKAPFLAHAVHIGRNFDEDERKPLDGGSAPRRMVRDDSFGVPAKTGVVSAGRASPQYGLVSGTLNSYSARVSESASLGARSQHSVGNNVPAVSGSASTNAWTAKEFGVGAAPPVQSFWSEQDAVSKLAHASAIEKVSSGRWQSKPSVGYQRDTESTRYLETENRLRLRGYDENTQTRTDVLGEREYMDAALARQTERSLNVEDTVRSGKELQDFERNNAPTPFDVKERKLAGFGGGQIHLDGKSGGSEMQQAGQSAVSERPKLKLLPRTRPLDSIEPVVDMQGHQQLRDPAPGHAEKGNVSYGNAFPLKPALTGTESLNPTVERPKLNLKPRSQPSEQPEGLSEKERTALFGGARPRELVLKDRGIDHASLSNHDQGQHHDGQRTNHSVLRADRTPDQPTSSRLVERSENLPLDQKGGKRTERNPRVEAEKVDMQRKNWCTENRRNSRDPERHQQEQLERQTSPETWRKPVEPPKPASPDASGLRHGKVASALELAQAFSKSHSSDPKAEDRYSGQRIRPGRPQVPFSRLTSAAPRAQINGY